MGNQVQSVRLAIVLTLVFLACSKTKQNIKNKVWGGLSTLEFKSYDFLIFDSGVRNVLNKANSFEPLYVL